jgi:hypothetical protein
MSSIVSCRRGLHQKDFFQLILKSLPISSAPISRDKTFSASHSASGVTSRVTFFSASALRIYLYLYPLYRYYLFIKIIKWNNRIKPDSEFGEKIFSTALSIASLLRAFSQSPPAVYDLSCQAIGCYLLFGIPEISFFLPVLSVRVAVILYLEKSIEISWVTFSFYQKEH